MKKVYFVIPYPPHFSPSQRFRFEQYFTLIRDRGYRFRVSSFLSQTNWRVFYEEGNIPKKVAALFAGSLRRLRDLALIPQYDYVFIHREAMPLGPPIVEWFIAKIYRKRIIYDFDDAIWLTDHASESAVKTGAKWRSKVRLICQWAHKISCGNEYLCQYAAAFNRHIVYNPTIVDTENFHNRDLYELKKDPEMITIGWTGSHSTLKYLRIVEDVLKRIETEHANVQILIIADQKPESNILSAFQFLKWNPASEIEDLLKIDIGIMPMPDSAWGKGKCGFKAIQYMALAIPPVVSPVGVNTRIVDHGINGYLADDQNAWYCCIDQLLKDASLRSAMGKRGRIKITDQYSVKSNLSTFLSLFE